MPLIFLVANLAMVAILWFGGHRIHTGDMQIGDITAIIEYMFNILFYLLIVGFLFMES